MWYVGIKLNWLRVFLIFFMLLLKGILVSFLVELYLVKYIMYDRYGWEVMEVIYLILVKSSLLLMRLWLYIIWWCLSCVFSVMKYMFVKCIFCLVEMDFFFSDNFYFFFYDVIIKLNLFILFLCDSNFNLWCNGKECCFL